MQCCTIFLYIVEMNRPVLRNSGFGDPALVILAFGYSIKASLIFASTKRQRCRVDLVLMYNIL